MKPLINPKGQNTIFRRMNETECQHETVHVPALPCTKLQMMIAFLKLIVQNQEIYF
jgi:hypothetical protein